MRAPLEMAEWEARVIAGVTPEQIKRNDLYKSVAARHFKVPYDEVTKEQRLWIKQRSMAYLYSSNAPKEGWEDYLVEALNRLYATQKPLAEK